MKGECLSLHQAKGHHTAFKLVVHIPSHRAARLGINNQVRWMFPDGVKHTAEVDQPSTIELESADGRPASRRQTNNQREVIRFVESQLCYEEGEYSCKPVLRPRIIDITLSLR